MAQYVADHADSTYDAEDCRYVQFDRDPDGVVFATEVVRAARWSADLLDPPPAPDADVRLVCLSPTADLAELPTALPAWLAVEVVAQSSRERRGVADLATSYDVGPAVGGPSTRPAYGPDRGALAAWRRCERRRAPHAGLDGMIEALLDAAAYPLESPADEGRRAALVDAVARRYEEFAPAAHLHADALERWFAVRFGTPEAAAEALLLARVHERDRAVASRLRFLREATVPESVTRLAFDRRLLLEQASPRRALDGGLPPAVLASIDHWIREYRRAYDRHYASTQRVAASILDEAARAAPVRAALARLNRLDALGPPDAVKAEQALQAALAQLAALPVHPGDGAVTAALPLGAPPPFVREVRRHLGTIEIATRERLHRLARGLTDRVLRDDGLAELERVLRAMQASEVAELAHVFDDALLERIDLVLREAPASPLARVAEEFPVLTRTDLDAAVEAFRAAAEAALAASPDGRVRLRGTARL